MDKARATEQTTCRHYLALWLQTLATMSHTAARGCLPALSCPSRAVGCERIEAARAGLDESDVEGTRQATTTSDQQLAGLVPTDSSDGYCSQCPLFLCRLRASDRPQEISTTIA